MDPALRDILTAVREGRLDPAQGARLLQEQSATDPRSTGPAPPATSQAATATAIPEGSERDSAEPSSAVWATVTDDLDAASPDEAPEDAAAEDAAAEDAAPEAPEPSRPSSTDPDGRRPVSPDAPTDSASDRTVHTPTAIVVEDRATTSLKIRAITRKVRIIGDPMVATVSIEGPHELRREGTMLICDSERDLPFGDPFAFLPTAMGRFRLQSPSRAFKWGTDLEIRVNPDLDLDVDLTAGSLHVQQVGRLRARVTAGSARVEDVRGPLDLHVVGGTAKIDTVMVGGDNRIRCDSGSVVLRLRPGSDVRFRPEAQLGRIVVDGVEGGREITVGGGTGRLRAEVVMGSIQVEVGE